MREGKNLYNLCKNRKSLSWFDPLLPYQGQTLETFETVASLDIKQQYELPFFSM